MEEEGFTEILKRQPGGPDAPTSKNSTGDLTYFNKKWLEYENGMKIYMVNLKY